MLKQYLNKINDLFGPSKYFLAACILGYCSVTDLNSRIAISILIIQAILITIGIKHTRDTNIKDKLAIDELQLDYINKSNYLNQINTAYLVPTIDELSVIQKLRARFFGITYLCMFIATFDYGVKQQLLSCIKLPVNKTQLFTLRLMGAINTDDYDSAKKGLKKINVKYKFP